MSRHQRVECTDRSATANQRGRDGGELFCCALIEGNSLDRFDERPDEIVEPS